MPSGMGFGFEARFACDVPFLFALRFTPEVRFAFVAMVTST
jgi:hypothetical protein